MKRIPELDGIRGLACLLVLLLHYVHHQVDPHGGWLVRALWRAFAMGWSGVDLFFVLSGFLLGGILLEYRQSANLFKVFYVRRTCRIFPVYFAWFGLFVVISQIPAMEPFCASDVPMWSYGVYLQNFFIVQSRSFGPTWMSATWSLAVEEQFYLLLPALVYFCSPRKLPWVLALFVMGSIVCRMSLPPHWAGSELAAYVLLPCRADALFLGALGAWAMRDETASDLLRNNVWFLRAATAALGCGMLIMNRRNPSIDTSTIREFGYTWIALFYLALLLLAIHDQRVGALFRWRPLVGLGNMSYGVYVYHFPLCALLHYAVYGAAPRITDWEHAAVTVASFLLTLALARISFIFLESPWIRLGHRCRYQQPIPAVVIPQKLAA